MSSRPNIHIWASFFTLHCDIFHLDIISSPFFWYHISPLVIFILCLFSHHCLLDIILVSLWVVVFHTSLHGGLSHSFLSFTPHGQWFRDVILRGCLVGEDSCYIRMWKGFDHLGMYFHESSFIIDQSMRKKKIYIYIYRSLFILSFFIGHVYGRAGLLHWVYVLERVRMRASFWDSILVYFGWEYESSIRFLWARQATFL